MPIIITTAGGVKVHPELVGKSFAIFDDLTSRHLNNRIQSKTVKRLRHLFAQLIKEIAAFGCSDISIVFGLGLAVTSFELAFAIQIYFLLLVPCLLVAALVTLFLIVLPRYIYQWRYGFPKVRHGNFPHLERLRKSSPF